MTKYDYTRACTVCLPEKKQDLCSTRISTSRSLPCRQGNAKGIDVFVEENNVIHPLEIKKSAAPDRREVKKYSVIDKSSKQFQTV